MGFKMNIIQKLRKNCKFCGEEFRSDNQRRVYCSDGGFNNSVKDRQKKYRDEEINPYLFIFYKQFVTTTLDIITQI